MKKTDINNIFSEFSSKKILVIGDVMLDTYLWGNVDRISPEAPVPVVSCIKKEDRLGGAANVALNIKTLGATPILCGITGNDNNGKKIFERLKKQNISGEGIIISKSRDTISKTRIISNNQHLIRIDEESTEILSFELEQEFQKKILDLMEQIKFDAVIFEDYDKGCISSGLINQLVGICNSSKIPVLVDPKKRNFYSYKNVNLFKPNLKELREGLKSEINTKDINSLRSATNRLIKEIKASRILVTLSDEGVYIYNGNSDIHIPAEIIDITDVSGAGDTVIAVASLCMTTGVDDKTLATISNIAGGLVCGKVGVVPINFDELLEKCLKKPDLF